jgi:hypothetical protein
MKPHGPFPKFAAMMEDAMDREPYVQDALEVVLHDLAFSLVDEDLDITTWDIINAMAKQCGMVIHVEGDRWSYTLTEG